MNPQEYPAGQIEPGWHIRINDQWLVVGVVIESETPDGARYITIVFEDAKTPAIKLRQTAVVVARPPQPPPEGSPGP